VQALLSHRSICGYRFAPPSSSKRVSPVPGLSGFLPCYRVYILDNNALVSSFDHRSRLAHGKLGGESIEVTGRRRVPSGLYFIVDRLEIVPNDSETIIHRYDFLKISTPPTEGSGLTVGWTNGLVSLQQAQLRAFAAIRSLHTTGTQTGICRLPAPDGCQRHQATVESPIMWVSWSPRNPVAQATARIR
jgi:hypothetical protein